MWQTKLMIASALLTLTQAMIYPISKTYHNQMEEDETFLSFGVKDDSTPMGILDFDITVPEGRKYKLFKMDSTHTAVPVEKDLDQMTNIGTTLPRGFYGFFVETSDTKAFPHTVDGTIHTYYAHGELSPTLYTAYQYYSVCLVILLVMVFGWLLVVRKYQNSLVMHHHLISLLLIGFSVETMLMYLYLRYINENGTYLFLADHLITQIQVIRMTIFRLFLILISMGYGVILPPSAITKMAIKTLVQIAILYYYVTSICVHFSGSMTLRDHHGVHSTTLVGICSLVQGAVESYVLYKVFTNLKDILVDLQQRGQIEKHKHYIRFGKVLMVSVGMVFVQMVAEYVVRNNMTQYFDWTVMMTSGATGFWHGTFLMMIVVMMVLFSPTKESKLYAYVQQVSQRDDDVDHEEPELGARYKTEDICLDVEQLTPVAEYEEEYDLDMDLEFESSMQQL